MIRLSTAYAKSRLSENVEKEDAEHALQLVNFAYYNEAEKKTREEEDSDDEDGNDEDGDGGAGASQRTAPRTPKTPKTPKSGAKSPKPSATSAALPPSTSKPAAKGKAKAKSVYDFDVEDGPAAGEEEGAPTGRSPRAKRAAKKSPAKAAEPEPEPEPIETTPEQQKIVRTALQAVFKAADGDSTTVGDLAAEINRTNPGVLNAAEVDVVLEVMAEENAIMKVDEQIILI